MTQKTILSFLLFTSFLFLVNCDNTTTYTQGKRLYEYHCANCHMDDGTGLASLIPPLNKSDYLFANYDILACIIKTGMEGSVVVNGVHYNQKMEGNPSLSDVEITNISNYIFKAWGNDIPSTNIKEIKNALVNCR